LWGGNYAADSSGEPVTVDPAVYFGDRECDLAMTRLFGGFSAEFYAAYQGAWRLDEGWQQRVELYNLYHVLNHYNLFGGSYLGQAEAMVGKLLAELGH
jgi:fructosamine-3-kinase